MFLKSPKVTKFALTIFWTPAAQIVRTNIHLLFGCFFALESVGTLVLTHSLWWGHLFKTDFLQVILIFSYRCLWAQAFKIEDMAKMSWFVLILYCNWQCQSEEQMRTDTDTAAAEIKSLPRSLCDAVIHCVTLTVWRSLCDAGSSSHLSKLTSFRSDLWHIRDVTENP